MSYAIHLRPLLGMLGGMLLVHWLADRFAPQLGLGVNRARMRDWVSKNFSSALAILCFSFFAVSVACKISQLESLALNSQDFWLFEDMLRQMRQGGFFVTRFAPQGLGWIQHGAIHATLSWTLLLPLAWIIGPTPAALVFNPLCFALAGWLLGQIARKKWDSPSSLTLAAAFLASSQVGRVLMYDVHPEAAYPLFILLWYWALSSARLPWLIFAAAAGAGVKEDAFLVFFPWFVWAIYSKEYRRVGVASLATGLAVYGAQMFAVGAFSSGSLGPREWQTVAVTIPAGTGILKGQHWDSISSAARVLEGIAAEKGGVLGMAKSAIAFLFSRPWLSLLLIGPWIALRPAFWFLTLPLALAYSQLENPSKLWTYYSAPFLGTLWLTTVLYLPRAAFARWTLLIALGLGGAGLEYHRLTPDGERLKSDAQDLVACAPPNGRGFVAPPWLGLIERERVAMDRVPPEPREALTKLDFALFSADVPRFETPTEKLLQLKTALTSAPGWRRIPSPCSNSRPAFATSSSNPSGSVELYVRESAK